MSFFSFYLFLILLLFHLFPGGRDVWRAVSDKNTCCRISNTTSKYIQLILGNIQLIEKNISLIVKNILLTTKIYNLLGK